MSLVASRLARKVGRLAIVVASGEALLRSPDAQAAPTSKLTYVRGPGADGCPAEFELRAAVARRVGYDPFFPYADRTVVAQIDRAPRGFHAQIRIMDGTGRILGERTVAPMSSCNELVESLALTISVAIDDLDAASPPSASEPRPAAPGPETPTHDGSPAKLAAPTPREDLATHADASRALRFRASLGGLTSLASAPSPAVGVALGAAARESWWQLGLEGRFDAPASTTLSGGGDVATSLLLGSVVPCVLAPGSVTPYVCAVGSVGFLRAESSHVTPRALLPRTPRSARVGGWRSRCFVASPPTCSSTLPRRRRVIVSTSTTVFTLAPGYVTIGAGIAFYVF